MIMLNGDLDKIWTFYEKSWLDINFWPVIQNGMFSLNLFIQPQSECLGWYKKCVCNKVLSFDHF